MYMDDTSLFVKKRKSIGIYSQDIVIEFGIEKC